MDRVRALLSRHFDVRGGELYIGGQSIRALAETHGTPLFVYDAGIMDRQLDRLRTAFTPEFSISYSVKANPCPAVLRHFVKRGLGLEIASGGEFYQAVLAGCPPERILFAGPGKTAEELEYVLEQGIGEIHVESLLEAERVGSLSARLGVRGRVALRVNPGTEVQGGAMRMGGKATPFGVDEEELEPVLDRLAGDAHLDFQGIHLFTGTQILDAGLLLAQYRRGIEIARRVVDRIGHPLRTLDFGGGLGIPYFPGESPLSMEDLAPGLAELARDVRSDRRFEGTTLLIEPGRYLVGEAGVYVARVNDKKVSRGKTFLVLDGGMNHHLAASGNLGQVIKRNFPVAVLNRLDDPLGKPVDAVGPLCTPLDVIARDVALPDTQVGDLFGVFQSGAYARASSPLGFLSQPAPAEVFLHDGSVLLARRRGRHEDTVRDAV